MSSNRDHDKIAIDGGELCPKCHQPMRRYRHSEGWRPRPGRGYYTFWDICTPCRKNFTYEAAKVAGGG